MKVDSLNRALILFDQTFDSSLEDRANEVRGDFLEAFPLNRVTKLTLREYVIGTGQPTFCAYVEAKTKAWASVQGATASKFGIYFGRTKKDPQKRYRITSHYSANPRLAFAEVKRQLAELLVAGKRKDFDAIDNISLSQMFKAKILSLYFRKGLNPSSDLEGSP